MTSVVWNFRRIVAGGFLFISIKKSMIHRKICFTLAVLILARQAALAEI
jgi:hypothetical protein